MEICSSFYCPTLHLMKSGVPTSGLYLHIEVIKMKEKGWTSKGNTDDMMELFSIGRQYN